MSDERKSPVSNVMCLVDTSTAGYVDYCRVDIWGYCVQEQCIKYVTVVPYLIAKQ